MPVEFTALNISANFQPNVAKPIDARYKVDFIADLDDIPFAYEGLRVYIAEAQGVYIYNYNYEWVPYGGKTTVLYYGDLSSPAVEADADFVYIRYTDGSMLLSSEEQVLFAFNNGVSVAWGNRQLYDSGGNMSLDWESFQLNESNINSLDWYSRTLYDYVGSPSLSWGQRYLYYPDGESAFEWNEGYFMIRANGSIVISGEEYIMYDPSQVTSVSWAERRLYDSAGSNSLSWDDRILAGAEGNYSVSWGDRAMYDENELQSLSWNSRILTSSNGYYSILWDDRALYDYDEIVALSWMDRVMLDASGLESIQWNNRILRDAGETYSLLWDDRAMYDGNGTVSSSWGDRFLYNSDGQTTVGWEYYLLYDLNGNSVDWSDRSLYDSNEVRSLNWLSRILFNEEEEAIASWSGEVFKIESGKKIHFYNGSNDSYIYQDAANGFVFESEVDVLISSSTDLHFIANTMNVTTNDNKGIRLTTPSTFAPEANSLITKLHLTEQINAIPPATIAANNGLSVVSNVVQQGGPLTKSTDIYGGFPLTYGSTRRLASYDVFSKFSVTNKNGFDAFDTTVYSIAIQSDGKTLVGGNFTTYDGQTVSSRLVRLNVNGSYDALFNNGGSGFNGIVRSIKVLSTGKILVAGEFTTYNGVAVPNKFMRLNSDGTWDTSFNNGGSGCASATTIYSMCVLSSDKILLCGRFDSITYNGVSCQTLIRINADGSLDTTFNTGGLGPVGNASNKQTCKAVAIQSDDKILLVGDFNNYNATNIPNGFCRLNSDGSLDTTFNSGGAGCSHTSGDASCRVYAIAIDADGKVLVAGSYTHYNAIDIPDSLMRLNSDGTFDSTFVVPSSASQTLALAIQSDGKILIGGSFSNYNALTYATKFARLSTTGSAEVQVTSKILLDGSGALRYESNMHTYYDLLRSIPDIAWNDLRYSLKTPDPIRTSTDVTPMVAGTEYFAIHASTRVVFTLPLAGTLGQKFFIRGCAIGGWKIAQQAGQTIYGSSSSTTGVTGFVESQNGDSDTLALSVRAVSGGNITELSIIEKQGTLTIS